MDSEQPGKTVESAEMVGTILAIFTLKRLSDITISRGSNYTDPDKKTL